MSWNLHNHTKFPLISWVVSLILPSLCFRCYLICYWRHWRPKSSFLFIIPEIQLPVLYGDSDCFSVGDNGSTLLLTVSDGEQSTLLRLQGWGSTLLVEILKNLCWSGNHNDLMVRGSSATWIKLNYTFLMFNVSGKEKVLCYKIISYIHIKIDLQIVLNVFKIHLKLLDVMVFYFSLLYYNSVWIHTGSFLDRHLSYF